MGTAAMAARDCDGRIAAPAAVAAVAAAAADCIDCAAGASYCAVAAVLRCNTAHMKKGR